MCKHEKRKKGSCRFSKNECAFAHGRSDQNKQTKTCGVKRSDGNYASKGATFVSKSASRVSVSWSEPFYGWKSDAKDIGEARFADHVEVDGPAVDVAEKSEVEPIVPLRHQVLASNAKRPAASEAKARSLAEAKVTNLAEAKWWTDRCERLRIVPSTFDTVRPNDVVDDKPAAIIEPCTIIEQHRPVRHMGFNAGYNPYYSPMPMYHPVSTYDPPRGNWNINPIFLPFPVPVIVPVPFPVPVA